MMFPDNNLNKAVKALFLTVFVNCLALFLVPVSALQAGQTASPWQKGFHHKVRLIAGSKDNLGDKDGHIIGVQIQLEKGWKTYWRFPGDAGVPPQFDWQESRNVKSTKIMYPAPARFVDAYSTTIGYKDEIVFPVHIEAMDASKPVKVSVRMEFGVCEDVCFFAEAKMSLELSNNGAKNGRNDIVLRDYISQVPKIVSPTQTSDLSAKLVRVDLKGEDPYLLIEARYPKGADKTDLFIEGPRDFYMPLPKRLKPAAGNVVQYKIDLKDGDDPKQLGGKRLTYTLVSSEGQVELSEVVNVQ